MNNKNNKNKFFKWLISEMAFISGKLQYDQHNKQTDWDNFFKKDVNLKLLSKYIPDYKIYLHGNSNYFLTDKEDNYKGHIQLDNTNLGKPKFRNPVQVVSSNQDGSIKGFYNIMFTNILTHTDVDAIFSDSNLSTNAVNSYEKLSGSNLMVLKYKDDAFYDIDELFISIEDPGVLYVVTPKKTKIELIERYNNYVTHIMDKAPFVHEYYKYNSQVLFMMLYSSKNALYENLI